VAPGSDGFSGTADRPGPPMIRALYRWEVAPGSEPAFRDWWHHGTLGIRRDRAGALGSVLLRSHDDPPAFVAVARWRSTADLEAFWESAGGPGGAKAFPEATLVSVEVLDELDDLEVR
jgi:heme-degrading monooxygenase HmoA